MVVVMDCGVVAEEGVVLRVWGARSQRLAYRQVVHEEKDDGTKGGGQGSTLILMATVGVVAYPEDFEGLLDKACIESALSLSWGLCG